MLIYLNVSVLVINLKMSIRVFGLNLLNMNLLTNLFKLSSLKEQKLKILILFLVTYISLFLTLVTVNLDKNLVKPKLNLLPRKKWKMKIYLLMMSQNVSSQVMDKFVIKLRQNNNKENLCLHIKLLVIFYPILNK